METHQSNWTRNRGGENETRDTKSEDFSRTRKEQKTKEKKSMAVIEARQEHITKEKVEYYREVKWVNGIGY